MSPKNIRFKKNKKVFYLGSESLAQNRSDEYVTTLEDAIQRATKRAEETGRDQIVVQIIRKIKVLPRPTKVITVS